MSRDAQTTGRKIFGALVLVLSAPLWLPLVILGIVLSAAHRAVVFSLLWLRVVLTGKDILFVSSDSRIWRDYMSDEILPLVRERAIILNWSERRTWTFFSLAAHAFHVYGGVRDFNPMVVIIRPFRRAAIFRFLPAFKDYKHGHSESVSALREKLLLSLGLLAPANR